MIKNLCYSLFMTYIHVLDVAVPAKYALRFESLRGWIATLPAEEQRRLALSVPGAFIVKGGR